ncbi:MAG: YkvA family protein [Thermacetogeniaceae bacterium]
MIRDLLQGKIVITDHRINDYIEQHYKKSFDDRLKDVKLYFIDEGLHLCAAVKPHRMLPDVVVDLRFSLYSFEFTPQAHIFTLKLVEKPELTFPELTNRLYVGILSYIFNKAAGSKRAIEILRHNLNKTGFLSWDDGLVAIDLDKHPEKEKLFGKRVPIIGVKFFDFVGIEEIMFGEGEVILKPKIYSHEFLKNCQQVFEQAAERMRQAEPAAIKEKKQTFSRLVQRVKEYPDALQAHVERELPKLKDSAGKIGGKLWEGVNYLWEAMQDPAVPREAKFMAIAALLYFVSPIDLISDILPGGYADDGVVLALAVKAVADIIAHHKK